MHECKTLRCELWVIVITFVNHEGPPELIPLKLSRVLTPQACRERWLTKAKPVCRTARRGWRPRWNSPKMMVKIKWSSFHLMLVIEACFRGLNDCFDGIVNSLIHSLPKNASVKAAASVLLSCWQRRYEGFRTSWSMCFKILAVIGCLVDLRLLLKACCFLAPLRLSSTLGCS